MGGAAQNGQSVGGASDGHPGQRGEGGRILQCGCELGDGANHGYSVFTLRDPMSSIITNSEAEVL